jgi:WD40 repeat protein
MMSTSEPERSQPSTLIQQDAKGDQNQMIGQAVSSTIVNANDRSQITIQQIQGGLSTVEEIKAKPLIRRSPYLGLRKFEVRDKELFFGRDQLIALLLTRLEEDPFLLVLGASGSGKSSLIRAGLIPKLREKLGADFRELIFTPDRDPFDSFRASLRSAGFHQSNLESLQTKKPEALLQTIQALKQTDEDWLIFVDQFEELFTLCQDLRKRQAYIDGLIQLVQARLPGLQLISAMRADFLDRLGSYPQLGGILQRSELITDMGSDELRLAIEQPAAQYGVVLESDLTAAIIHELKGHSGTADKIERVSLPLLQYTLKLLWENSGDLGDRTLRVSTYRRIGGVRGALQHHVDTIYQSLPHDQQQAAKHIFLQLVDTISADAGTTAVGKAVSRRAPLIEFKPSEQDVLQQLIDAGLLVSDAPHPTIETSSHSSDIKATVELAHETLIDAWDPLKGWIEESRPLIRLKNQLKDDANRWYPIYQENPTQAEDELWQGSKLQHLLSQRQEIESRFGALSKQEVQFLQSCEEISDRKHRQQLEQERKLREAAEARAKAEEEKKLIEIEKNLEAEARAKAEGEKAQEANRRVKVEQQRNRWLIVSGVVLTGLTVLAFGLKQQAEKREKEAVSALVARPQELLDNQKQLEALIESVKVLKELRRIGGNQLIAPDSLQDVVYGVRERNRLEGQGISSAYDVSFSSDGRKIVLAENNSTVRLWDLHGKPLLKPLLHDNKVIVWSVGFSRKSGLFASGDSNGRVWLWNSDNGNSQKLGRFQLSEYPILEVAFSPDDQLIAAANYSNQTVDVWRVSSKQLVRQIPQGTKVYAVDFSPDGQTIATVGEDGKVKIWKILDGSFITAFSHSPDQALFDVAFGPDGTVASAGADKQVKIWRISDGKLMTRFLSGDSIYGISFSPDGRLIAAGSRDKTIKVWQIEDRQLIASLPNADPVNRISFSPTNSDILASAGGNLVRLWSIYPNRVKHRNVNLMLEDTCNFLIDYLSSDSVESNDKTICDDVN